MKVRLTGSPRQILNACMGATVALSLSAVVRPFGKTLLQRNHGWCASFIPFMRCWLLRS